MARTKKADSAINSFFTDTSKEMVERQETIVEKVVNPDSEPAAEKKAAASEGPTHRLSVIVPDDLYWQLKKYLVEHRGGRPEPAAGRKFFHGAPPGRYI